MSAEVLRLRQAIEQFKARQPHGLPEGVIKGLDQVVKELGRDEPARDTPGASEVARLAPGTDGTGEHFSRAALGNDGPSPGQREARGIQSDVQQAAREIIEKANG